MGQSKASLDWYGSTLLRRVVGIVGRATGGPVVVVRPVGRSLPALPPGVEVVDDARAGEGPLQALAAGLSALEGRVGIAYASATDAPLLHPAFVQLVCDRLDAGYSAAVPEVDGPHPLAAASERTSHPLRLSSLLAESALFAPSLTRAVSACSQTPGCASLTRNSDRSGTSTNLGTTGARARNPSRAYSSKPAT